MGKQTTSIILGCISCLLAAGACMGQGSRTAPDVSVKYEEPVLNANYPELVYWFVTPETLKPERYTTDIQHIAHHTAFDFAFLTARQGVGFVDSPSAHQAVAGIVQEAHRSGLRIGVTMMLGSVKPSGPVPTDSQLALVSDAETVLDGAGVADVTITGRLKSSAPTKTELLRVYAFRRTGEGEYDPASLQDVTAKAKSAVSQPGILTVKVNLGAKFSGYQIFAMSSTWFNELDLFSDYFVHWMHGYLDQYRDIPLDGTAMDEFRFPSLDVTPANSFRSHFSGHAFSAKFEAAAGMPLDVALFNTRYAPAGHPEVRIKAINDYWEVFRQGTLHGEQEFYRYSRQLWGDKIFAGIHNTFHNKLTNDEAWETGLNWWTIPREYGQSDEDLSLPLRMGLLVSHPGKIMYDQFYGFNIPRFGQKALTDARFNARLHYHGYNDTGRWGVDLASDAFLSKQNLVEQEIRLLNQFDPASPKLPLLVVFGVPALLNWYPDAGARNNFDVNGSLHIEEKVKAIWDAGYRCAVVPSDLLDNGSLTLNSQNQPVLNGHVFQAVVYLYPEYAKPKTMAFLDQYTKRGGALMLEGRPTRNFDGLPIGSAFEPILEHARVKEFLVDRIGELGVEPSVLRDIGGELEDGSIVLTDYDSLQNGEPKSFSVDVNGHRFTGNYVGVFALKVAPDGAIEKLACGHCSALSRDGREIVRLGMPADLVLRRQGENRYVAILAGRLGSNSVVLGR